MGYLGVGWEWGSIIARYVVAGECRDSGLYHYDGICVIPIVEIGLKIEAP